MAIVSVCNAAGLISGSYIAGVLLRYLTLTQTLCIVTGLLSIGFFYCMVRIVDQPPPSRNRNKDPVVTTTQSSQSEPKETDGLLRHDKAPRCECCKEVALTFR